MVKTLTQDDPQAEHKPETAMTRHFQPEEFEADTDEERPISVLAERRRQFLSMLKARRTQSDQ